MGERMKALRKALHLTQQELADRIGLTKNFISLIETECRTPSDRTISDICREFNVNEAWLRTGEGEMFREVPREQAIADFVFDVTQGDNEFKRKLVAAMAKLDVKDWEALERLAVKLLNEDA